MKKHKICIIGDGLSGLITAQILGKLDVEIDLISKKSEKKNIDNRVTAISPSNYKFISEFLPQKDLKFFFECKKVNLYHENENNNYVNFMNFENSKKNIILTVENKNLKKILIKNIRKNKKIKIFKEKISKIDSNKTRICFKNKERYYDMIFLCMGKNQRIVEKLIGKRFIQEDKKEIAFTCLVNHSLNVIESKQYFLKEGPMALLPINSKKFSLIWSVNKSYRQYKDNEINKLVTLKLNNIFSKNTKFNLDKINRFPIYFKFHRNFFQNNIFAIGDSVYSVFPIAGQGFNLVLRDIQELYKKIKESISIGLQLKDSLIFNDLISNRKPENLLYGLGIDLTQKFFRYSKLTAPIKNNLLKDIDKFPFLKKIGLKISDKGIINN
tara:strand:+ start:14260 stop:15408 length:1149 start_codon:yes stop_codon:yes gene_type:complete